MVALSVGNVRQIIFSTIVVSLGALFLGLSCLAQSPGVRSPEEFSGPPPTNTSGPTDCILGPIPPRPDVPCGTEVIVTQEILVPAINGGACAPQTLTYRGELCPITTVSPTATPTARATTPTVTPTVTPTATTTPTVTPTATPTCALSLPAAPQCQRGSVCVERDRCGQCIGWRCKCVDTEPPDTHGRTGCYRPGWPQTKVVCARGVTNWSGGWSGAFTYVYSSSYGIKSSKDEGTVCWQCVCERSGGSGCFAPVLHAQKCDLRDGTK